MSRKQYILGSVMMLVVLCSGASALVISTEVTWNTQTKIHDQTGGVVEVVDGGHVIANARVDLDGKSDGTGKLIMNGGWFESKVDFKHPDNNTGYPCYIEINAGLFTANQIQSFGVARLAYIVIGSGTFIVQSGYDPAGGNAQYNPHEWILNGTLYAKEGYDLVVEDQGGGAVKIYGKAPARNPVPANGSTIVNLNLTQLSWMSHRSEISKVWFGKADANSLDYRTKLTYIGKTGILNPNGTEVTFPLTGEITLPLDVPATYSWAVESYTEGGGEPIEFLDVSVMKFNTAAVLMVTQPASQCKFEGETAVFTTVVDSGTALTSAKWYQNGEYLADGVVTGSGPYQITLTIPNVQNPANAGQYYCIAANAAGSVQTDTVYLVFSLCPSADLSGDCEVDFADFSLLANRWLMVYDSNNLTEMSLEWLTEGTPQMAAFDVVAYPAGSIKTLAEMGLTVEQFTERARGGADYAANTGYDSLSIIASPYFNARINGIQIPVYGTLSHMYIGAIDKGAIHSYTTIEVHGEAFPLCVQISSDSLALTNAIVLPATLGVTPTVADGTVSATLTKTGMYTFLFNNASQEYAYTLFVRNYVDEAAEIAQYRALYGTSRVIVYEPGVHYVDYINITRNNTVVYLRAGSLLVANHKFDINSDTDRATIEEPGALAASGMGNIRFPFINCNGRSNVKVLGRGTIDFTRLDWHERSGLVFSISNYIEIRGIMLINAAEWNVCIYRVSNLQIHEMAILGYRCNSDAIDVCNCNAQAAVVKDCFARTGDDLFQVKTLGGPAGAICSNVTFQDCVAWGGGARSYGITGEVEFNISNITFKDCAVIYRDAIWDNNRLGSLVVIVEGGGADISNITFENIEIFKDFGRAINCNVYNPEIAGCAIQGIHFRNITCNSALKGKLCAANAANSLSVTLGGVKVNGVTLNADNVMTYFEKDSYSSCTFE